MRLIDPPETHPTLRALWLAAALVSPSAAFAAGETLIQEIPAIVDSSVKTVDSTRDYVAQQFVGLVTGIDRFFGTERNFQETNKSMLRLNLSELMQPDGNRKTQLALNTNVHLPATEKRLHLLLESDPERNVAGTSTGTLPQTLGQLVRPVNYGVAIRYVKELENILHLSTDVGVKLPLPLQPFARARASYTTSLDGWRMKTTQSLFWFSRTGAGETTQIDFEHALGNPAFFRASSTATWMHDLQRFDLREDLGIYQTLTEKRALLYEVSVIGVDRPRSQVDDYVLSVRYRQQLHRRWLYLEVNPQLHFPKENSYRSSPLLLLRLETLFDAL